MPGAGHPAGPGLSSSRLRLSRFFTPGAMVAARRRRRWGLPALLALYGGYLGMGAAVLQALERPAEVRAAQHLLREYWKLLANHSCLQEPALQRLMEVSGAPAAGQALPPARGARAGWERHPPRLQPQSNFKKKKQQNSPDFFPCVSVCAYIICPEEAAEGVGAFGGQHPGLRPPVLPADGERCSCSPRPPQGLRRWRVWTEGWRCRSVPLLRDNYLLVIRGGLGLLLRLGNMSYSL